MHSLILILCEVKPDCISGKQVPYCINKVMILLLDLLTKSPLPFRPDVILHHPLPPHTPSPLFPNFTYILSRGYVLFDDRIERSVPYATTVA